MPTPQTDLDVELVARLRRGDEQAFRAIWDQYHDRLIKFVYRYTRSTDAAADIVQSVFFTLWRERETLAPRTTLLSHLYGGARFRALRELRHTRVERAYEATVGAEHDTEARVAWNAGEAVVEHDERMQLVNTALSQMTPRVREIFLLHRKDGLTAPQIAATLGIKVQVVYNKLSLALKVLAKVTAQGPE
jgi:RNA polymerase sigma factor (sigma-70 family)